MEYVPRIFEAVFQCTLEVSVCSSDNISDLEGCVILLQASASLLQMITKNFEDYPEHRLKFFSLLRAIGTHCFQALIQLSSQVSDTYAQVCARLKFSDVFLFCVSN